MLTYDFACIHCDRQVQMRLKLSDYMQGNYDDRCPETGCSGTIRRVILTAPGTVFKGEGWTPRRGEE